MNNIIKSKKILLAKNNIKIINKNINNISNQDNLNQDNSNQDNLNVIKQTFNDRTICIVGYAKYMKNKNLGNYINSFDEIVRLNIGIFPINFNDLGKKTTLASFSISLHKITSVMDIYNKLNIYNKTYNDIDSICNDYNIKYILGLGGNIHYFNKCKKYFNFDNKNITHIFDCDYNKYINEYFFGLTCGLKTILFILSCKPKKLFICGFDFSMNIYEDYMNFHKAYNKSNIKTNKQYTYEEWSKIGNVNNWHSTDIERYILGKLYYKYNFEVDNELEKILKNINYDENNNKIFTCSFYNKTVSYKYIDLFNNLCNFIDNEK